VTCAHCECDNTKKHGRDRNGIPRYRCRDCGKTFLDKPADPIGDHRIPVEKAALVVRLLLEGMSVRAAERMSGIHRDTICRLVVTVGNNCRAFMRERIRNVPARDIQVDEMWGFVGCKQKTCELRGYGAEKGDAYCFVGMERGTKLVYAFHVGKRGTFDAYDFCAALRVAAGGSPMISTDGFKPYRTAVPMNFGFGIDFAQLVKKFGASPDENGPQRRYSPAKIIGIDKTAVTGDPDMARVCTSHVERLNLSIRTQVRRLTRLTIAHSKKWENHEAMLGLFFAHFNFCRKHASLKTTPAVAHGIASEVWSVERLLTEAAA